MWFKVAICTIRIRFEGVIKMLDGLGEGRVVVLERCEWYSWNEESRVSTAVFLDFLWDDFWRCYFVV